MDWNQLSSDFKKSYEGCWCLVTLEGTTTPELFKLSLVEQRQSPKKEGIAPLLHFTNNAHGEIILNYENSKSDVDFRFPPTGVFDFEEQVFMCTRKHVRQWKKGICSQNFDVWGLYAQFGRIFGTISSYPDRLNVDELTAAFEPRANLTLSQGLEKLEGRVGVALNSEFSLGQSPTNAPHPIIWYKDNPIGFIQGTQIMVKEPQFYQELVDFLAEKQETHAWNIHC